MEHGRWSSEPGSLQQLAHMTGWRLSYLCGLISFDRRRCSNWESPLWET